MPSITRADSRADQKIVRSVLVVLSIALATVCQAAVRSITWDRVDPQMKCQYPAVMVDLGRPWYVPPEKAAEQLRARPAGTRALILRLFVDDVARNPKDACYVKDGKGGWIRSTMPSPWMQNGIRECRARVQKYFEAFKKAGGQVDYVLYDAEENLSCWYLTQANIEAICADPRFRQSIALGSPTDTKSIFNVSRMLNGLDVRKINYLNSVWSSWNAAMSVLFNFAVNEAGFKPVQALYPNVIVSNYGSASIRQVDAIPNGSGEMMWSPSAGVGTHDSWQFYGIATDWQSSIAVDSRNTIGSGAFAQLRLGVIGIRGLLLSSKRPQMPWIAHRQFGQTRTWGPWTAPFSGTEYWDEHVRQLVMHGCDTLLMFNPEQYGMPGPASEFNPVEDQQRFDAVLADLNDRLATANGPSVWYQKAEWNDRILATGRPVRGGTLWRFSFAEDVAGAAVVMRNGEVRTITRQGQEAGAWFFAESANPIAERSDRSGIAVAEIEEDVLRADLDGNGTIDAGDHALVSLDMGEQGEFASDLDRDGTVTQADVQLIQSIQKTIRTAVTVRMPTVASPAGRKVDLASAAR